MRKKLKSPGRGKPKGNKRERTRDALIESAASVIAEIGYDRMSLEEVARRAGMSRGAVYGNFDDKDDLILAVIERHWRPITGPSQAAPTLAEQMHVLGCAAVSAANERQSQIVSAVAFRLYALTHKRMRKRVERLNHEIYQSLALRIENNYPATDLPMPPDQLVRVIHALTDGLLLNRALMPDEFPDALIIRAFEQLARPQGRPPSS
jgi:AcrR family transcriptional regulator